MNDSQKSARFWLANGILAVAMIMLLFMESLWAAMGNMAMVLWAGIAGAGAWLLMKKD